MVLYVLSIKADLEGVATLALKPDADICVSVRNPMNQSEIREKVVVDPTDLQTPEIPAHGRHRAEHPFHLALKWDGEQTRSTIRIMTLDGDDSNSASSKAKIQKAVVATDSGNFCPILLMECDGLEPYAFHSMGKEFVVTNKTGIQYDNVDLSSGDWNEYDMGSGSTSVMNLEAKFD